MYFWSIKVLYLSTSLSWINCLISLMELQTEMPSPRLVFSPGLTIQILEGTSVKFYSLGCLGMAWSALLVTPRIDWFFIWGGLGSKEVDF
jgi:hypothetical protein